MAYLSFNGCVIGSHRHGYAASLSQHRHQLSRIAQPGERPDMQEHEICLARQGKGLSELEGHQCGMTM
jgi:hypothetical protein